MSSAQTEAPAMFSDIDLNNFKGYKLQARKFHTSYRDIGLRFFDLPEVVRLHLMETHSVVKSSFLITPEHPVPPLLKRLKDASNRLDDVPGLVQKGQHETATRIVRDSFGEILGTGALLARASIKIREATRNVRRDLNSPLQQARAGLLPEDFLAWCRLLREVDLALQLRTIEDDPHQILAFVVDDEERPEEASERAWIPSSYTTEDLTNLMTDWYRSGFAVN